MDFRISQLQSFLALADHLHCGQASRVVGVSQQALTYRISSLEGALNVKLFERTEKGLALTEPGMGFRHYAQRIVNTVENARERMNGLRPPRLCIACGSAAEHACLPAILGALGRDFPEFELETVELTAEQQVVGLFDGTIDAVLMTVRSTLPGLRFDPVCNERLHAMVSAHSLLAARPTISVESIRTHSIIVSRVADYPFAPAFLRELFAPFGIAPNIIETPRRTMQLEYVALGVGILLTTGAAAAHESPKVVVREFDEDLPRLELGLLSMERNQSAAMHIFRKIVHDVAAAQHPAPA